MKYINAIGSVLNLDIKVDPKFTLPGSYIDAIPQNIIEIKNEFELIDDLISITSR